MSCENCNKQFSVTKYELNSGRKYCSRRCSQKVRTKVKIYCRHSGREKLVSPIYFKRGAKFCSFKCRNESMIVAKKCTTCGKNYKVPKRYKHSKFCSQKCSQISQNKKVKIDWLLLICKKE